MMKLANTCSKANAYADSHSFNSRQNNCPTCQISQEIAVMVIFVGESDLDTLPNMDPNALDKVFHEFLRLIFLLLLLLKVNFASLIKSSNAIFTSCELSAAETS